MKSFNKAGREEDPPKVLSWDKLYTAFGVNSIRHARQAVSDGIKVRMASKQLNIPFMIAHDIVEKMAEVDPRAIKISLDYIKNGTASSEMNTEVTERVAEILDAYSGPGSYRMAIDHSAQAYWTSYYGPFGQELVREVQKRVRADVASRWLRKNGVDAAAAEYYANYFGEYGQEWVSIVPKKISPAK